VGVNSKLNLVPVVAPGKGEIFFSSSSLSGASYTINSQGSNGWSVKGHPSGEYIGFTTTSLETFYAVDIQQLSGSSLTSFSVEYSMNGQDFIRVQDFKIR
jgi:hypothetical protein